MRKAARYRAALEDALELLEDGKLLEAVVLIEEQLAVIPTLYRRQPLRPVRCEWCGNEFEPWHEQHRFCGVNCRNNAWRARRRGDYARVPL